MVAGSEDRYLYKLYRQGGNAYATWFFNAEGAVVGAPAVDANSGNLYFGTASVDPTGNGTYSLWAVANDGSVVWRQQAAAPGPYNTSAIMNSAGVPLFYIGSVDGTFLAVDTGSGGTALPGWSVNAEAGSILTTPALDTSGSYVYFGSTGGTL